MRKVDKIVSIPRIIAPDKLFEKPLLSQTNKIPGQFYKSLLIFRIRFGNVLRSPTLKPISRSI